MLQGNNLHLGLGMQGFGGGPFGHAPYSSLSLGFAGGTSAMENAMLASLIGDMPRSCTPGVPQAALQVRCHLASHHGCQC
jgi:hypothetical protein